MLLNISSKVVQRLVTALGPMPGSDLRPIAFTAWRLTAGKNDTKCLRWGECAGLAWSGLDLATADVVVQQVAVETAAKIEVRPYPKSRAGFRRIPPPGFALDALHEHRREHAHPSSELVFAVRSGVRFADRRSTDESGCRPWHRRA